MEVKVHMEVSAAWMRQKGPLDRTGNAIEVAKYHQSDGGRDSSCWIRLHGANQGDQS